MDWGRILFIFFTLMSLTSTMGFLFDPNIVLLFLAAAINFISTTLRIGTKKLLSSELLASSIVADFHLIPAFLWFQILGDLDVAYALAIGALAANVFSIIIIFIESAKMRDTDY
ncbi:hypothetical protein CCY99_04470 [Helicobacter sp. 16-1353]|uniref:DUF6394 family protein n=1 Tax=Helicobacter sp. 16-1353 TaxID=2004996 RepID=UPI000DCCD441|nr:DUF6394 family protein [Helicobacter sp. 16-1353]RAX54271.1 hypothetical protein CCY99_04470 [Helicobacter sp. 16-1353]